MTQPLLHPHPSPDRHGRVATLLALAVAVVVPTLVALLARVVHQRWIAFFGTAAGVVWATWVLYAAGLSWRSVGFVWPKRPLIALVSSLGWVILAVVLGQLLTPVLNRFPAPDFSMFAGIRGNVPVFIGWLLVAWTTGAFGEELLYRAFLCTGLSRIVPGWVFAVVVSSVIFGVGHLYQGPSGAILAGVVGLVYGLAYVVHGRQLGVPILTHGLYDTLGFLTLYLGMQSTGKG